MDDAVSDHDAGVLVAVGVPGNGHERTAAIGHILHAFPESAAETVLGQDGFELKHVCKIDIGQIVHGRLCLAVLYFGDMDCQIRTGIALLVG